MDDPKSKKGRRGEGLPETGGQGIDVRAKGDSSSSKAPLAFDDGATMSDALATPPPPEKPELDAYQGARPTLASIAAVPSVGRAPW